VNSNPGTTYKALNSSDKREIEVQEQLEQLEEMTDSLTPAAEARQQALLTNSSSSKINKD